jgi:DNA-binding response OmpR family regulator
MKLLIVDDELDLCFLLQEHFEDHFGGEVFTATTPGEALRLLEQLQPEGMLLDINLRSRLNGFDVLARATEISPAAKVIMVTGANDFGASKKRWHSVPWTISLNPSRLSISKKQWTARSPRI